VPAGLGQRDCPLDHIRHSSPRFCIQRNLAIAKTGGGGVKLRIFIVGTGNCAADRAYVRFHRGA
jgi:hypothetical protein